MIIIKIQENIIKCERILNQFENDSWYKTYKMFGGSGFFERTIREISNSSINLRNKMIVDIEAVIRATNNKDLIELIERDFFSQITEAASKESLIRIVNLNSISIPTTAMNIISQDDKVILLINSISININSYNDHIAEFRQEWNKFKITLYSFPPTNEYPNILDGQINLQNLIAPPKSNQKISPIKQTGSLQQKSNISKINKPVSPNTKSKNITSKF